MESSHPGVDHAGAAAALFTGPPNDSDGEIEPDAGDGDGDGDGDGVDAGSHNDEEDSEDGDAKTGDGDAKAGDGEDEDDGIEDKVVDKVRDYTVHFPLFCVQTCRLIYTFLLVVAHPV